MQYAFIAGVVSVVFGLVDGTIGSPQKALNLFLKAYATYTYVTWAMSYFETLKKTHPALQYLLNCIIDEFTERY